MEKYKLFLNEIKEENIKIGKKIIFVNNRTKYKHINGIKVEYNKYFIDSYENEKDNNVYKYYKHKILNSKKKKIYLNNDFPYFEIYKNTNDAFKNNLGGYNILKLLNNYNELQLFDLSSKNKLENINYLYKHFIEIIIKKRDLYNINHILTLTKNIKKINYYNPYFCKLICREICLDLYKIKNLYQITGFIDFLMHFNIFNFYYLNKIYKYIIYLILDNNKWNFNTNNIISQNCLKDKNIQIIVEQNEWLIKQTPNNGETDNDLLLIEPNDIIILSKSFFKYKYFDINLLILKLYVCNHDKYQNLRKPNVLYHLSKLCNHYIFINKNYTSYLLSNICKNVIIDMNNYIDLNDRILLLKSFYNICKFCKNTLNFGMYNIIISNLKYPNKTELLKENQNIQQGEDISNYILTTKKKKKRQKKKYGEKHGKEQNTNYHKDNENEKINSKNRQEKEIYNSIKNENRNSKLSSLIYPIKFYSFYSDTDINLKKHKLDYDYTALDILKNIKRLDLSNNTICTIFDTIKYIILFIELKILSIFPFKKKNIAEINFLKRKNFEKDNDKNIYKYISQNISKKQSDYIEHILKTNKNEEEEFDDSSMDFLFYLNYKNFQNDKYYLGESTKEESESMGNQIQNKYVNNMNEKNNENEKTKKACDVTSEDIDNYIKNKKNIQFNLNDDTYYSHIFFHLSSIQLSKTEEEILATCLNDLLSFKRYLQNFDVNNIAELFYYVTTFQIIQGLQSGTIIKNKYGYSKIKNKKENEELYKILSDIIIKKIINIKEENLYKVILSCANTAYSIYKI
ncbi:conserved Plasmodium protein, unknown function [Plasmodium berghei]|uniref:Uncharacterized protein n=1 Tax=Plasmodium berghei TaxID=5821 RepID=A0A0Y9XNT4_PLABE|nr:conserved Plasmodium protein, unknown function [Plasmodium berghei]SCM23665.1 conserved Plasmodium protein, unknown function [Plasmodium berghei]SCN26713.1 conserved Plasmodium protein, unknown function [Plasmodium berghei]SCO63117.1 conserved Plasmodium protein, unknown function [Plasmodium berghei]